MCPKELFSQFEIYKKVNGIEDNQQDKIPKGSIEDFL